MEKWVSKIEATSMFKVTERTLDNWVKSGKINKTRKNGQICYEVSSIMAERNIFEHKEASKPPVDETAQHVEPLKADIGPSKNELVLEARLDEKQTQINVLSEKLESKYKDLNTLALNNGSVSEKAALFQNEIESLRKEKEDLRKEKEIVLNQKEVLSERSFSRFGTYLFFICMIILIIAGFSVYVWKNKETESGFLRDKGIWQSNLTKLENKFKELGSENETLKQNIVNLGKDQEKNLQKKTSEQLHKIDELYKQIIKKEKDISEVKESVLLSNQKISEEKERVSELQKQLERLQKAHKEALKENSGLKIKIGVHEALKKESVNNKKPTESKNKVESDTIVDSTE